MLTFKYFYKILSKKIITIIVIFGVFIALCAGFTAAAKQQNDKMFEDAKIKVAVIDGDNSGISRSLTAALKDRQNYVELKDNSRDTARDMLYNGEIDYALFIPDGFENAVLNGEVVKLESAGANGSYNTAYIDNFIDAFVSYMKTYVFAGYSLNDAAKAAGKTIEIKGVTRMVSGNNKTHEKVMSNGSWAKSPVYFYFAIYSYAIMSIIMFGLAPVFISFSNRAVKVRTECSSTPALARSVCVYLSAGVFAVVACIVLFIYGVVVYRQELFTQSGLLCLLNMLCFVPVVLAITVFVAELCSNKPQIVPATVTVFVTIFAFLGGVFVPMSIMSAPIKAIAKFIPVYWYMRIPDISYSGAAIDYGQIGQAIAIQLLFGAAFLAAAMALSARRRRE